MSRRNRQRAARHPTTRGPMLALAGGLLAVALMVFALARWPRHVDHPAPRADASAAHVLHGGAVPRAAGAAESYAVARAIPAVLDGMRCFCACGATLGHRSLLSCFEDEHGAFCQVCQDEAIIAGETIMGGGSLREARRAVDERFGPG